MAITELKNVRSQFIDIAAIYGVDLEKGTYTPHPEVPNPKLEIRQDVLMSLALAESPSDIPALDIFINDDGHVITVDGMHRILNAIKKCEQDKKTWSQIKVSRISQKTVKQAAIYSFRQALEDSKGTLTAREEASYILWMLDNGFEKEEITQTLGKGSPRWVSKFETIINGIPALQEAVKDGSVSVEIAAVIADKIPLEEQKEKLEIAKEKIKNQGGSEKNVRTEIGARKGKETSRSRKEVLCMAASYFEYAKAHKDKEWEPYVEGFWDALMWVNKMDQDDMDTILSVLFPYVDGTKQRGLE